jgi:hypothetical protein
MQRPKPRPATASTYSPRPKARPDTLGVQERLNAAERASRRQAQDEADFAPKKAAPKKGKK